MAETTAHSEAPGHGTFPPFESRNYPSQFVWLALTFVLLYVLMSRIALPRISGILAERSKRISEDLMAAQRLKEQSEAAGAAYEKALADARARAQAIASTTRDRQAAEAEGVRKNLEAQLHERLAAAEQSIAATRASALSNVRTIAADTASVIVQRLIGTAPSTQEIAAALGEADKH